MANEGGHVDVRTDGSHILMVVPHHQIANSQHDRDVDHQQDDQYQYNVGDDEDGDAASMCICAV